MATTGTTGAPRRYRSSTREERARATRRRVLDAATAEFLDRGFAGTTVRAVAARADVSVPTVEQAFGTKARLLKAAIDVAIAGDDEAVPVLDRGWTAPALAAPTADALLDVAAAVIAPAMARSSGLVVAVFEGAATDPDLADLAGRLTAQRAGTAGWLVDALAARTALRPDLDRDAAVDTVWLLMEPAVFERLVRHRGWTVPQYQAWFARSLRRLLVPDPPASPATPTSRRTAR